MMGWMLINTPAQMCRTVGGEGNDGHLPHGY